MGPVGLGVIPGPWVGAGAGHVDALDGHVDAVRLLEELQGSTDMAALVRGSSSSSSSSASVSSFPSSSLSSAASREVASALARRGGAGGKTHWMEADEVAGGGKGKLGRERRRAPHRANGSVSTLNRGNQAPRA